MPTKKKKSRKQRGSRYCGWGQVGQHRKGGMRGGKGRAGGRKHFWIRTVKYEPDRYLNKGFKPPSSKEPPSKTINIGELNDLIILEHLPIENDTIDLSAIGYEKLLGRGNLTRKINVIVDSFSERAEKKITEKGGQILSN
jgi:large subunit ribosomal protein L15